MSRIELTDTPAGIMMKMSNGNPGALNVLISLYKESPTIDPDAAFEGLAPLLSLDTLGIYGPDIWLLYKDCCLQSLLNVETVLRAWQLGLINGRAIHAALKAGEQFAFESLLKQVQVQIPAFGRIGETRAQEVQPIA